MKKIIILIICLSVIQTNYSQSITTVEDVYGGRINAITGGKRGAFLSDSFRIIVATESANSLFYADANFPDFGTSSVGKFTAVPSASANVGYGSNIQKIGFHKNSETIFFIASGNIYSTTITATDATKLTTSGLYTDFVIERNQFYSLTTSGTDNSVYYSTIDATTGVLTASSNTTISSQSYTSINVGWDDKLYLFKKGTDPQALLFSGDFSSGINLASSSSDAMASLSSTYSWDAMGVYTDGTIFVGGTSGGSNPYKYIASTNTFNTAYATIATSINGTSGSNIEFRDGLLGNYFVYFGTAYSNAKGVVSTWQLFGNAGYDTHPNDGIVRFFKNNSANNGVLLLTTDAGLGWTKNSGSIIADINNGILATQVEDFDMNSTKTFGWLAAKDGIRYVNNYNNSAKAWTTSFWPNGDGSPYYSSEMVGNDSNSVYVGNLRIYKSTNKGTNWTQVFTPENAPYNFPSVGTQAQTIAVSDSLNDVVMAGYYIQNSGQYGGVFYSLDAGTNWSQLLISASSLGQDVNVNDIEFTTESGKVVAYIGVDYINSTVRGMYKAVLSGSTWTVTREEIYSAATSKFSVRDIFIPNKDTIVAVGSFYNPVLAHDYPIYFNISKSVYNNWSNTVVDTSRQGTYTACTWNYDTIYYAYDEYIYYDIISFNSSSTSRVGEATYSIVDIGTDINVLYYDELLVGSTTGFRSIRGAKSVYTPTLTPTIAIVASKTSICPNNNVTFTATVTNGGLSPIYQWRVNNINVGTNSSTFTTNALPNNANVQCLISVSTVVYPSNIITITVYGSPIINAIVGTFLSCNLGAINYLTNSTSNGIWSSSNTSVATIATNGKVTSISNGSTNISYTVTSLNGCSNSVMALFKVSSVAEPATITGASMLCVGSTTILSTISTGGLWSSLNNRASINSNSGLLTGTNAGTTNIRYTITNGDGCSNYKIYSSTVNKIPSIPGISYAVGTINPQKGNSGGFCPNKTFTLVGNPAGGVWSSTGVITVHPTTGVVNTGAVAGSANLTYTYTNANGCSNSRTISGSVNSGCLARGILNDDIELIKTNDFTLYPNPSHSFVNLNMDGLIGNGNIIITDLFGKQIKIQPLSIGNNLISIDKLSKGIYLVNIITNQGKKSKKLIVE